jgi:hypothetical protein
MNSHWAVRCFVRGVESTFFILSCIVFLVFVKYYLKMAHIGRNDWSWQTYPVSELCRSATEEGVRSGARVKHAAVRLDPPHHPGSWPGSAVDGTHRVGGWHEGSVSRYNPAWQATSRLQPRYQQNPLSIVLASDTSEASAHRKFCTTVVTDNRLCACRRLISIN